MELLIALFLAGVLTILLPCILPLLPIVLGVSVAGRSMWRPLLTVLGMVLSFVGFTFLLLVFLNQFVELADYIRLGTYAALFLFGVGFLLHDRISRDTAAFLGGVFFLSKGLIVVGIAAVVSSIVMDFGGFIAARLQQFGSDVQAKARGEFGADNPLTALIIGLTLGLVWVPCAGPALGFALTLVREQPGPLAAVSLFSYAAGTAVPLLIVGYGGQAAVHSVHAVSQYSGRIKQIAGALLILTAVGLHFQAFERLQLWVLENTSLGSFGSSLEEKLIGNPMPKSEPMPSMFPTSPMALPKLPVLVRAPEFTGLGPWHNSEPFTLESLKGKVVLVDFWTYSCINCIRTLPYMQGYWEKFKGTDKFALLGVHTPEFTFEKSEKNVAMAIKDHGLTYPVAQDNDFGTWSAFANRYWPAKYLIDANGYIRYTHFGEGAYEETDKAIQSLLQEIGVSSEETKGTKETKETNDVSGPISPETYLSSRSWPAFGNAAGEPSSDIVTYSAPASMTLNKYYLVGDWQLVNDEYETLRSDTGEIRMKFTGGEINLVMGIEEGAAPVSAVVSIDGKSAKNFSITKNDLYELFKGSYGEHEMVLKLMGKGLQAFAFTFGG